MSSSSPRKSILSPNVSLFLAFGGGCILCLTIIKSRPETLSLVRQTETQASIADLSETIQKCTAEVRAKTKELTELDARYKRNERELSDTTKELEGTSKQLSEERAVCQGLQREVDKANEKLEQAEAKRGKQAAQIETLKKGAKKEIETLKKGAKEKQIQEDGNESQEK